MSDAPLTTAQMQEMMAGSPFIAMCNIEVMSFDEETDTLTVRCPMRPEFERGPGSNQWHGGPIAAIIDTIGDCVLIMRLGRGIPTVNFRVDYFRPAIGTDLIVSASIRRLGRSVGVSDIDVTDESGRLIAIGRGTYSTAGG
ncbi:MAG: PaaI family thioesterase [Pseudomonadota bacterium]|nr:PaaI family thioesterase [Pseudomonadota bacterium]